ncbi:MAG: MogA/MoaB family molybdenum cofactor biosynthesis protein [Clostridiales bacterium]|nr:MogA/MoaB family molybdenum cofactor biosynthesis protein [Clostridiales bacterium]MCI7703009.1 MogA/MoaB family molybdenum cofactor biosynthesis protein [Clostridiales bacterium]MDY3764986.1 MogA/MoaB family molybdenum cofactor biosynthesis protein [Candidatus Ventricola sp.]MDY4541697.1 MogA/MoaB family molybdenum cofactor biosynthesis protein [Candidatus Ventricola sp.]MDY4855134.1 MogA/MoaB family molybdenum cofactor biosynthesis protein [Candidatus Ventricola sp.]
MAYTAAVITVSDKGARGEREDKSGPALCALALEHGYDVVCTSIIPDEIDQIKAELLRCCDELGVRLVLTTGGTGFSPRDVTPEATMAVVERTTPGIPELMRAESMKITPRGCLSRSAAGIRGRSLIINLPGSPKAAKENLLAVIEPIKHGLDMLASEGSADCAAPEK